MYKALFTYYKNRKKICMKLIEKLMKNHQLSKEEYIELLNMWECPQVRENLCTEAVRLCDYYYGRNIFTRGLIEFTNYCKNNCYYCGIRNGNHNAVRYRLSKEEILECCVQGYALGFRTFVLQGGEDPYYTDERVIEIIKEIKEKYPDCAVTLSIGEKGLESYQKFRLAGADRYLLRHETANEEHYQSLHPQNMHLSERKECLWNLKKLGYQVGAGFMVGSPNQTIETLAEDLVFLQELQPEMVGIGPFIPHRDTQFRNEPAGSVEFTLFLLSLIRIILPKVLLPATTALGTMDAMGREKGVEHGANVVMPNLSPMSRRRQYDLYDNKISMNEEAAEGKELLRKRMEKIGYCLVDVRGDAVR